MKDSTLCCSKCVQAPSAPTDGLVMTLRAVSNSTLGSLGADAAQPHQTMTAACRNHFERVVFASQATEFTIGSYCTGAVELRNSLGARFGVELPATVTFDYPTITTLAGYLAGVLPLD